MKEESKDHAPSVFEPFRITLFDCMVDRQKLQNQSKRRGRLINHIRLSKSEEVENRQTRLDILERQRKRNKSSETRKQKFALEQGPPGGRHDI